MQRQKSKFDQNWDVDTYQIFWFALGNPDKVEHQELETVPVLLRQHVERLPQMLALFLRIRNG
jgi:hypothetical protein